MKKMIVLVVISAAAAFFVLGGRVDAYMIGSSANTSTPDYSITAPFEDFFQSLMYNMTSVGNETPVNLNPAEEPLGQGMRIGVKTVAEQFDAWLYGFTGFHILNFFVSILSIFSWLLGEIKGGVDWVLGLL